MFKTLVLAALGFVAVSAQFLNQDERALQAVLATSAACSATATADTGCATAGFCCATATRTGTTVTAPAALCVPTDFLGQAVTVAGTTYTFAATCVSPATVATTVAAPRVACTSDDGCTVGQCCATATLSAGAAGALGTTTRKFCTSGAAAAAPYAATYTATTWLASYTSKVDIAACTPKVESFGAYIKASLMMVVAVLSVALF